MDYRKPREKKDLESAGSERLRAFMRREGWGTWKTHGNVFQKGWPDIYASHPIHGQRWIETKTIDGRLERTQVDLFAEWARYGVQVWVLRDEKDYRWLFKQANAWEFGLPKILRPT